MSSSLDFAPISVHLTALSQCGQMTEISYLKPPATQIRHRPRTNAIYSRPCYPNSEEINPKCDHFRVRPPRCTARRDETEVGGGRAGERMTTEDDGWQRGDDGRQRMTTGDNESRQVTTGDSWWKQVTTSGNGQQWVTTRYRYNIHIYKLIYPATQGIPASIQ